MPNKSYKLPCFTKLQNEFWDFGNDAISGLPDKIAQSLCHIELQVHYWGFLYHLSWGHGSVMALCKRVVITYRGEGCWKLPVGGGGS